MELEGNVRLELPCIAYCLVVGEGFDRSVKLNNQCDQMDWAFVDFYGKILAWFSLWSSDLTEQIMYFFRLMRIDLVLCGVYLVNGSGLLVEEHYLDRFPLPLALASY